MDKVILLAVGGVVAVGTVLYYLLVEREQPQKQRSRPRDRPAPSPRPRSKSPPISYSDIKPGSCRNRKATSKCLSEDDDVSKASEPDGKCEENIEVPPDLNNCEAVGKKPEMLSDSDPKPTIAQNQDVRSSPEITKENLSSALCQACREPANATLYPCKHRELCSEHTQYYFDIAKDLKRPPLCPNPSCRRVLQYFSS